MPPGLVVADANANPPGLGVVEGVWREGQGVKGVFLKANKTLNIELLLIIVLWSDNVSEEATHVSLSER